MSNITSLYFRTEAHLPNTVIELALQERNLAPPPPNINIKSVWLRNINVIFHQSLLH